MSAVLAVVPAGAVADQAEPDAATLAYQAAVRAARAERDELRSPSS